MTDVFLSYKREEREAVTIIAERLLALKIDVWFDVKLESGGTFDSQITSHLVNAKAVVTCWTPAAIESDWVRAEAALARESGKLVTCMLHPVQLLPPFNLIQAEDLTAWAGQTDDPAWTNLLKSIGKLIGRPGIETYSAVMASGRTSAELRAWAETYAEDPLAGSIWDRIAELEGEDNRHRLERERKEAAAAAKHRRILEQRSKELAKERGLRNSRVDFGAFRNLSAAVLILGVLMLGAFAYAIDLQKRNQAFDSAQTPKALVDFIDDSWGWRPRTQDAYLKLDRLDDEMWFQALESRSISAIDKYLAAFEGTEYGKHKEEAMTERDLASARKDVQSLLFRLQRFEGLADGAVSPQYLDALNTYQYKSGSLFPPGPSLQLIEALNRDIAARIATRPEDLVATSLEPPSQDDYRQIAARLGLNALVLPSIQLVEADGRGFGPDGRLLIRFERQTFSRLTNGRFDGEMPVIDSYEGQKSEWESLQAAYELAPEEAYAATSLGMFGIMGFHAEDLGFYSPPEFARFVAESETNQVKALARFVERNLTSTLDAMRTPGWNGFEPEAWVNFSKVYNGPAFESLGYHKKLASAYRRSAIAFGQTLPGDMRPIAGLDELAPQPKAQSANAAIDIPALGEDRDAGVWAFVVFSLVTLTTLVLGVRRSNHA